MVQPCLLDPSQKTHLIDIINSQQKNELHCYCGNDVPLKTITQDGHCKEICKNGQHICGFAGYTRVVTGEGRVRFIPTHAMFQPLPPTKAAIADFRWTSDYGNNTNKWCAALQYVRTIGDYYSPMLARSDCRVDKKAVCVKNSEGECALDDAHFC